MKNIKVDNLAVFGCSFTSSQELNNSAVDYSLVETGHTFGDIISNHYGWKFHECGNPGSSNSHISNKFYDFFGENQNLIDNTFVIIGWSEIHRLLFWSNKFDRWINVINLLDDYGIDEDGTPVFGKYIINSWSDKERKKYTQNFLLNNFQAINIWLNQVLGIQSFCKVNKIPYYMFNSFYNFEYINEDGHGNNVGKGSKNRMLWNMVDKKFFSLESFSKLIDSNKKEYCISSEDEHPNKLCHKLWGEKLIKWIEKAYV